MGRERGYSLCRAIPMFQLFKKAPVHSAENTGSFGYIQEGEYYFDSACQSLRPKEVIDAERVYYENYNACGGRVKYKWGQRVDEHVSEARSEILKLVGKSEKEYTIIFTLNTTFGINMVLHQIDPSHYSTIVTSDIEHNSTFLPTMTWAERNTKKRVVIERLPDGTVPLTELPLESSILLMNTVSNIDGRVLKNINKVTEQVHAHKGLVLLDCAQMFGSHETLLKNVDFDAAFSSGHKMYGPSIGFMIVKNSLITKLKPYFIGGGTVQDVVEDSYTLMNDPKELYALLEPGLQNWAGIIGLLEAIRWKKTYVPEHTLKELSTILYEGLRTMEGMHLVNTEVSSTISFYTDKIDAHQLALYLAEQHIMCRSGYFCCHYYLKNKKHYPPLLRVSLGLHTTKRDIEHLLSTLTLLLKNV